MLVVYLSNHIHKNYILCDLFRFFFLSTQISSFFPARRRSYVIMAGAADLLTVVAVASDGCIKTTEPFYACSRIRWLQSKDRRNSLLVTAEYISIAKDLSILHIFFYMLCFSVVGILKVKLTAIKHKTALFEYKSTFFMA